MGVSWLTGLWLANGTWSSIVRRRPVDVVQRAQQLRVVGVLLGDARRLELDVCHFGVANCIDDMLIAFLVGRGLPIRKGCTSLATTVGSAFMFI
jgi:hypothetical protein